jgi:hypothetical protein
MPISDVDGYDAGHFGRVYEFIVKPACRNAGFKPVRADEVQVTNYIVVDILRKILDADMVVCDLSARNANVLYELGIRQAFNRPVTLIRDSRTPRIFDIQGLRDLEYDETLRIDKINAAVEALTNLLKNTSRLDDGDINSIVQLLGVKPAQAPSVEVSKDTSLVLNAINDISKRLLRLEDETRSSYTRAILPGGAKRVSFLVLKNSHVIAEGLRVTHPDFGEGLVNEIDDQVVIVGFNDGRKIGFPKDGDMVQLLQPASMKTSE